MSYVNEGFNHGLNLNLLCKFGPLYLNISNIDDDDGDNDHDHNHKHDDTHDTQDES